MNSTLLRTLAYADIFDYPLTGKEIHYWAIGESRPNVRATNQFHTLPNRQHLVGLRRNKQQWNLQKIALAKRVGKWLQHLPTIQLIAITGALAMNNADKNDDIDLMIVTSPNVLWLTRILVVMLTEILGIRRRPPNSLFLIPDSNNKICLNLWLDETALSVPIAQRNLYTAHEVAQAKCLWSRGDTYKKFLSANSWVNNYLPNIKIPQVKSVSSLITNHLSLITVMESLAFKLQYWYMRSKMTRERVSPHYAFFHPRNTQAWVMREYNKRLKKLGIRP